jgi:aspartyl-tRNA(Asn)/glutamyl-tRNA(Gln) amidotransferase subunit C
MFDQSLIQHLAELSKISFTEKELSKIAEEMTDIVALMDQVKTFPSTIEPLEPKATNFSSLREDIPSNSSSPEEILENAKQKKSGLFVVPKVV